MQIAHSLLQRDLLPDPVIRLGIRRLLRQRLREEEPGTEGGRQRKLQDYADSLREEPLALATELANEQHYELPTAFFQQVLGRHLKYSSALWPEGTSDLDQAEEAMLRCTAERADLADGQSILELGCGWGSLTLHMAERFPRAQILAVSNSESQQAHLREQAKQRGLDNVRTLRANLTELSLDQHFERVVSVEMFEHMRNYPLLLQRIASWLRPEGKLFVHVFCHRRLPYRFEVRDASDWMARYFFTGGQMPSADLLGQFQEHLSLEQQWLVNGQHYGRTARAWLHNMDQRRAEIQPLLERTYGAAQSTRWWVYWRVFFMACEELFGFRKGEEWMVAHYRFAKPGPARQRSLETQDA